MTKKSLIFVNNLPHALSVFTAAKKISDEIYIFTSNEAEAKNLARIKDVVKIFLCSQEYPLAENIAPILADLMKSEGCEYLFAPSNSEGKDILPRVSALLDVQQISDIIQIVNEDTFIRPIYAGNALAKVRSLDKVKIITVRITAFTPAEIEDKEVEIEELTALELQNIAEFIKVKAVKSERPELTSANIIISGGRGLASKENFSIIEKLADKLGAAVGASRAAVDAGFISNDLQIGQTGKIVAPELYVAVGISGAIQHIAGIKDSKIIVAINKDENAPIFEVADFGLVADLFDTVPEFISKL